MALQNSQIIPLQFPMYGIDEGWAYGAQPQGTAPTAQNVRAYDALKKRLRGGSRPGTTKWNGYATQIESTNDILNMNRLVATPSESPGSSLILPISGVAGSNHIQTYSLSAGTQSDTIIITGTTAVHEIVRDFAGNYYAVGEISTAGSNCWKLDADLDIVWELQVGDVNVLNSIDYDPITHRLVVTGSRAADLDQVWILDADNGAELNSADPQGTGIGSLEAVRFDLAGNIYVANYSASANSYKALIKYDRDLDELWSWWAKQTANGGDIHQSKTLFITADNGVIIGGEESDEWDDTEGSTDTNDKNIWNFDSDGNLLWSYLTDDGAAGAASNYVTSLFQASGETDKVYVGKMGGDDHENVVKLNISDVAAITEDWTYQTSTDAINDEVMAIDEDSDGNIIVGGDVSSTWAGAGTGKNIWRLNYGDGTLIANSNWPVLVANIDPVTSFALTVKSNSYTSTSRQSALTLVMSDGDIVAIRDGVEVNPTDSTTRLTNIDNELPFSQPAFGKMYFIDGLNEVHYTMYDDSDDDIVAMWIPTVGQLPVNPKLMALYRGRIVLSGSSNDPHNWFMAKVGDPLNWNYFPATPTVIQAIAGNNSEVGLIGDIVTALMPYSDDLMLFGCDHSLWVLSGDPAAGGSLDRLSNKTGVAWGRAWTTGPKGEMYFFGTDGIYRMVPGKSLENITDKRRKKEFDDIDRDANYIILEWDYLQQGLMVLVVNKGWVVTSAQTTYFWEERTAAWWNDVYPKAMGPLSIFAYDDDDPDDKAFLMGCADGYIRQSDFTKGYDIAADDSQTDITAFVEYSPIILDDNIHNTKLTEINATLAEDSGAVDLLIKSAESNERLVVNASTKIKKSLTAGRNKIKQRIAANCIGVELNKTGGNRWAIDSMKAVISSQGRVRRTRSS